MALMKKKSRVPNYHVEPPIDIFSCNWNTVAETHPTLNNGNESANVLQTQNTDLIVE